MSDVMTSVPALFSDLRLLDDALTDAVALAADRRAFCTGDDAQVAEAQHQAYIRLRFAVRAAQCRAQPLNMTRVWEYAEAVHRCVEYARANPGVPLRDNPHNDEIEQTQLAVFGAPWVYHHCNGCRRARMRLDPDNDFLTRCCRDRITVNWEPDWIDNKEVPA